MRRAVFGLGTRAGGCSAPPRWRAWRIWPASAGPARSVLGAGLAHVVHRHRAADAGRARAADHAAPGATGSRCCCSRTWPSFRWWRWCRCWSGTPMPDHVPWRDVLRAAARDRGHPGRRALPAAPAVPRHRRRENAGGVHRDRPADRGRHGDARRRWPGCRRRSARSWPACCCRTPNTATSCRPTSRRSRGCCSASSSSPSACRRICRWRCAHPALLLGGTAALLAVKAVIGIRAGADRPAGRRQCAALRPGAAAGERVQLRAVRRRRRGGRAGAGRGGDWRRWSPRPRCWPRRSCSPGRSAG